MERTLLYTGAMITDAITRFFQDSDARMRDLARQTHARSLEKALERATEDGTLDAGELAELERLAEAAGLNDATAALERVRAAAGADGSVDASSASDTLRSIRAEVERAVAGGSGSDHLLETQLAIQADRLGSETIAATMAAYHRSSMTIIGNLKA